LGEGGGNAGRYTFLGNLPSGSEKESEGTKQRGIKKKELGRGKGEATTSIWKYLNRVGSKGGIYVW